MMRMMSMIMAMSLMRMMIARVMSMKVQVNRARQLLARMELGLPPLLPPTPRTTRSHAITSDSESDSSSANEGVDSD